MKFNKKLKKYYKNYKIINKINKKYNSIKLNNILHIVTTLLRKDDVDCLIYVSDICNKIMMQFIRV